MTNRPIAACLIAAYVAGVAAQIARSLAVARLRRPARRVLDLQRRVPIRRRVSVEMRRRDDVVDRLQLTELARQADRLRFGRSPIAVPGGSWGRLRRELRASAGRHARRRRRGRPILGAFTVLADPAESAVRRGSTFVQGDRQMAAWRCHADRRRRARDRRFRPPIAGVRLIAFASRATTTCRSSSTRSASPDSATAHYDPLRASIGRPRMDVGHRRQRRWRASRCRWRRAALSLARAAWPGPGVRRQRSRTSLTLPAPPSSAPVVAVEYHHAALGRYVLAVNDDEVAALDRGAFAGWERSIGAVAVWRTRESAPPGAVPVCRFFSPVHTSALPHRRPRRMRRPRSAVAGHLDPREPRGVLRDAAARSARSVLSARHAAALPDVSRVPGSFASLRHRIGAAHRDDRRGLGPGRPVRRPRRDVRSAVTRIAHVLHFRHALACRREEIAGASARASLKFAPRSHERYRETKRTDESDDDLLPCPTGALRRLRHGHAHRRRHRTVAR